MVHYGYIIQELGPLINIWCMRFEQENRYLKEYIKNTSNRKNIPLSICRKEQYKLAYRIKTSIQFKITFIKGPALKQNVNYIVENLASEILDSKIFVKWIIYNGLKFEKNSILHFGMDEGEPRLCTLEYCIVTDQNNIYFICNSNLINTTFNSHLNCYEVSKTCNSFLELYEFKHLSSLPTTMHYLKNGNFGIILYPFNTNYL